MLPYVQIGDIWQNKRYALTPEYQQETFQDVDITRGTANFIKAGLPINDEFILPLDQHPWHRQHTQSYCISVKLADGKRIIIPCMEMIRFYFGSSSGLLHRLFTSQVAFDHLWKSKHHNPRSGLLHLKLADGISGASASDIGRIALDHEALHAASMLFSTCQLALLNSQPVYPYTGFPFTGKTTLVASGKWLSRGWANNSTFVVYRLQTCSHPFPFKSLDYEVTDIKKVRSRKNKPADQTQADEEQKATGKSTHGGNQTLSDDDPGKSRSSQEHRVKRKSCFPDLDLKPIWRVRYDTVDAPSTLLKFTPGDEEVSVGESHGNSKVRAVDIVCQVNTSLSAHVGKLPQFVRDGIKAASDNAKLLAHNAGVELITLPGYSHPVFSLPYLIDENGEIDPVSFCLDGYGDNRSRRGCFVEIKEGGIPRCRVFIVECEDVAGEARVIDVDEFDLRMAMERLIDRRENQTNGCCGDEVRVSVHPSLDTSPTKS
ncbi:MAG: hypothetical protein PHD65_02995 [Gallionella sp.]|nr:hypothetical protein [Gallionella sp.]